MAVASVSTITSASNESWQHAVELGLALRGRVDLLGHENGPLRPGDDLIDVEPQPFPDPAPLG